ncbi:MAG: hypothetical protein ACQKBY_03525 [Verrucomicrobiales bacterium]
MKGLFSLLSLLFLFACQLPAAETVGYLLRSADPDSLRFLIAGERSIRPLPEGDPFAPPREQERKFIDWEKQESLWKKNSPADLTKRRSSLLPQDARTIDVTEALRGLKYLVEKDSWAVLNLTSKRLVVHGSDLEQVGLDTLLMADLPPIAWHLECELFELPQRQVEVEEWTGEMLEARQARSLGKIFATGHLGMTVSSKLGEWELVAEADAFVHRHPPVVEGRYTLKYQGAGQQFAFTRQRSFSNYMDFELYEELGSAPGMNKTLLLRVIPRVRFLDGTPYRERCLTEEGKAREEPLHHSSFWEMKRGDMVFTRQSMDADFLSTGDDENDFLKQPVVEKNLSPFPEVFFHRPLDVKRSFEIRGLKFSEGEWIYYDPKTKLLWSGLRGNNVELFSVMTEPGCCLPPKNLLFALSLVSHENEVSRLDLRRKKFAPETLLAEAQISSRPGAKNVLLIEGKDAESRIELEVEPNIAANDDVVEARWHLQVEGLAGGEVSMECGLTLHDRQRILLPLGEGQGKKISLVIEARVIDGTGRSWLAEIP